MKQLFGTPTLFMRVGTKLSQWSNIETQMSLTVKRFMNFYHNTDAYINSSNILVKIINQNMELIDSDKRKFEINVRRNIPNMTALHNIVDFINKGETTKDIFFDTDVVLLNVDLHSSLDGDWREFTPLVVSEHKGTNIGLFDMSYSKLSDDIIYCELDILTLMSMYRSWRLDRLDKEESTSANNFVASYVLPNAMISYLNIALTNTFFKMDNYGELENSEIDFPEDLKRRIVRTYSRHYKDVMSRRELMDYYLNSIPTYKSTALKDLQIMSESTGINVLVYILVSRIRVYDQLMLVLEKVKAVFINTGYRNDTQFMLEFIISDNALSTSEIVDKITKINVDTFYKRSK